MTEPPFPSDPADKLRRKARRFLHEYLIDLSATEAALRAGYGPERRKARAMGNYFLRRPDFRAALAAAMRERERRTLVTADRVIEEYARIAFADISRFAEWGPDGISLRPQANLSAADLAAVAEVSRPGSKRTARLRLHDKRAALAALARHTGLFGLPGGRPGADPPLPYGTDFRTPAEARAKEALRRIVDRIIAERPADEPAEGPAASTDPDPDRQA
jgi:phage terminase small subunit